MIVRRLRRGAQREFAGPRIVFADRGAWFNGAVDGALVANGKGNLDFRFSDGALSRLFVAIWNVGVQVVRHFVMQLRCARFQRFFSIHHDWQWVVVHLDGRQRIIRLVACFGHHSRHRIAGVAHTIGGENITGAGHAKGMGGEMALHPARNPDAGEGHHLVLDVSPGQHAHHAGHLQRGAGVNTLDARMRILAAQNGHMEHAGQREVRSEFGFAAQHLRIFLAFEACAQSLAGARRGLFGVGRLGCRRIGAIAAACPGRGGDGRDRGRGFPHRGHRRGCMFRGGGLRGSGCFRLLRPNARLPKHSSARLNDHRGMLIHRGNILVAHLDRFAQGDGVAGA